MGDLLSKTTADVLKRLADQRAPQSFDQLACGIDPACRFILGDDDPNRVQIFLDPDVEQLYKAHAQLRSSPVADPIETLLRKSEFDHLLSGDRAAESLTKAVAAEPAQPGYILHDRADDAEFALLRRNRSTISAGESLSKGARTVVSQHRDEYGGLITKYSDGSTRMTARGHDDAADDGRYSHGPRNEHGVERMRSEHARHAFSDAGDREVSEADHWRAFADGLRECGMSEDEIAETLRECKASPSLGFHPVAA